MGVDDNKSDDLRNREFEGLTFDRESFIGTDCRDAKFIDCIFSNSVLSSLKIDGALVQAEFRGCKIEGINFFTAKRDLLSLSFTDCLIRHSSFAELKLKQVNFANCKLQNVDFADSELAEADFSNASFEDCIFNNTNLSKADFRGATGYVIDPTRNKIKGAKFSVPEVLALLAPFGIDLD